MLEFIPQPWRDRVSAVFVVGFFLAWIGRKVAAAMIRRGSKHRVWAVLVEIGPGLRAVREHVGPHLPAGARAALDSLRDTDPPGAR